MTTPLDTTFLKVISGELPSHKIYEDEYTYAFLANRPVSAGHTLVVPKVHSENIYDTTPENLAYIFNTISKVAKHLKEILNCDGMNVSQNNEIAGGQAVFHIHFHLIPRYQDDNLELFPENIKLIQGLYEVQQKIKMY